MSILGQLNKNKGVERLKNEEVLTQSKNRYKYASSKFDSAWTCAILSSSMFDVQKCSRSLYCALAVHFQYRT